MKKYLAIFPLLLFLLLAYFLWGGLHRDPHKFSSPLIGKAFPAFTAPALLHPDQHLSADLFRGHVSVLNVFASWCDYCLQEHSVISGIKSLPKIKIYGLNYKDEMADARQWLQRYGNPFDVIIFDPYGKLAINLGVYGTPETFVVDSRGIIRYKHVGPITDKLWSAEIYPILLKLLTVAENA